MGEIEKYSTGATRSADQTYDPEGFLNPEVLRVFCEYMDKHRVQANGDLRASDNWQKGMASGRARRSLARHYFDVWLITRGYPPRSADCKDLSDALCGVLFNTMVLLKNYADGEPKIDRTKHRRNSRRRGRRS